VKGAYTISYTISNFQAISNTVLCVAYYGTAGPIKSSEKKNPPYLYDNVVLLGHIQWKFHDTISNISIF
jgi:hypothetical protein